MPPTFPATRWLRSVALALAIVVAPTAARAQQAPLVPVHVVEAGETLWQIAERNGLDTATLMRLNEMEDGNVLLAGTSLKLTASPTALPPAPAVQRHTVIEGDTLAGIAALYGVSVDKLIESNGIEDPNIVVLGAQLLVSGSAPAPPPPPSPAAEPPVAEPVRWSGSGRSLMSTYVVQPGETLGAIARQYGVEPRVVAQATGLEDANLIRVGTVLKIPVPAREHLVVKGETLYGIAAAERVDLGALIDFNEISDPGLIRVGEVLVIPVAAQTAATLPAPAPEAAAAPSAPAAAPLPPPPPAPSAPPQGSTVPPAPKPSAAPAPAPTKPVAVPPGTPTDGAVGVAVKLLGSPYVFGGSGPGSFDCSGLVWYVFKQVGRTLTRGMLSQYNSGPHPAKDQLKPGDLVFFQNTYMPGLSHNGIYIGNGSFIHAADERSGVTISSLAAPYWASRYFGATRTP